jgi:C-terminal processing protease CtpA/Prc
MKKMAIGPFSWTDPIVSLSAATSGGFASEDYAGNFGNQMLERFRATFDYERRTIHLEPGARYRQRDRFSRAGLLIAKMPDGYRAMQVLNGSAAERAGVIEGDAVRSVDGRPIERWSQDELSRRFEDGAVGEKHVIEVVRAGKPRKLTMKLAEIL